VHRLRRGHFVKLCHGYLPAGKIAHRNNPNFPDYCPLCKHPAEDHQHILQCPDPSRKAWRKELLLLLSNKCDTLKTDPILKNLLINGISCWLKQINFDETGIPLQYSQLLAEQRELGWYQFFLSRISLQWSHQQSKYLKFRQNKQKGLSGPKWAKIMCTIITTQWVKLWDNRNGDRHGVDSSTKAIAQREQAIREIEALYTFKTKVLQRHRDIFLHDIEYHTAGKTVYMRQWINTNQSVIQKSTKDAKIKAILNVRIISTYFKPRGNQN
jgi:hypothetical protein